MSKQYSTLWGFQCVGCEEWYSWTEGRDHTCAGAADGYPLTNLTLEQSMERIAKALARIAAALEISNEPR